jgi:hypothetical protein
MNSGEHSRIRTAAASSILDRDTRLVLRHNKHGYDLYTGGDSSPIRCQTWPQARRALLQHGVSLQKIDEISTRLVEGTGIILRREV